MGTLTFGDKWVVLIELLAFLACSSLVAFITLRAKRMAADLVVRSNSRVIDGTGGPSASLNNANLGTNT